MVNPFVMIVICLLQKMAYSKSVLREVSVLILLPL